jgi:hypothetical protein
LTIPSRFLEQERRRRRRMRWWRWWRRKIAEVVGK